MQAGARWCSPWLVVQGGINGDGNPNIVFSNWAQELTVGTSFRYVSPEPVERTGSGPVRFECREGQGMWHGSGDGRSMLEIEGVTKVFPPAKGLVRAVMFARVVGMLGAA